MRRTTLAVALSATLATTALATTFAWAAQEPAPAATRTAAVPSASDVLFEQSQMKNTTPGSTISYDYLRRSGIARGPYGPPFNDAIKLTIEPGQSADNRDIRVQMFTGANRVPAGPFTDMPGNPVLSLFLENHLKGVASLLEGNPRYIKNAIRKGLRERATVTAIQIPFKGRTVEGWRIEVKPFEGDPLTDRMRGFDSLTYTFVTAPDVPGEIVSIHARAVKPDGGELLEERLDYDQKDS